jgi:hypothetical protein
MSIKRSLFRISHRKMTEPAVWVAFMVAMFLLLLSAGCAGPTRVAFSKYAIQYANAADVAVLALESYALKADEVARQRNMHHQKNVDNTLSQQLKNHTVDGVVTIDATALKTLLAQKSEQDQIIKANRMEWANVQISAVGMLGSMKAANATFRGDAINEKELIARNQAMWSGIWRAAFGAAGVAVGKVGL